MRRIQDSLCQRVFDTVIIEGKEIKIVTSTKLLDLTIANDLTWNDHVTEITKKASNRLLPNLVKKSGSSETRSSTANVSWVKSAIDYAAPVFSNGLLQYLKNELALLEKRPLSIISSGKC